MKILFKKRTERKNIISYQINDQTDIWMEADDFLILHDLSHFAIEKTLQYKTAFWGLIHSGIHPKDFENKDKRKEILLTNEAWYAESLANLFLIELSQGKFENFNKIFSEMLDTTNPDIPKMELDEHTLMNIRNLFKQLVNQWNDLNHDDTLILHFF